MNIRKFFPLGKAYGEAFCNRVEETAWLIENIKAGKHSLLVAPRRFGKSSLAEKAIQQIKLPAVTANFHLCTTEQEVTRLITTSVSKAINLVLGPVNKLITSIKKYVSNLTPQISIGPETFKLELTSNSQKENNAVIIAESLLLLDKLLGEKKKSMVLFFDEFQEIARIPHSSNIEGAIRTAAQEMQNISIIFSGSIRSLLLSIFNEEKRPLYKLCRKLTLSRISEHDYDKHINKAAHKTWKKKFTQETLDEIMNLSKRHPYYVNYLCDTLWQCAKNFPTKSNVVTAWEQVVEEEWSDALKEISLLSLAQRRILRYIALENNINLASHENIQKLSMPASTIMSAIEILIERDYIEKNEAGKYQIVNPVILSVLSKDNA